MGCILGRAGTIIHPAGKESSGYCVNMFRDKEDKLYVVFATETLRGYEGKQEYTKRHHTNFACRGEGLHITQLESGYYMVGFVFATCVSIMLVTDYGYGIHACAGWASGLRREESIEGLEDTIYMDTLEEGLAKIEDEDVVMEIKESIKEALMEMTSKNRPGGYDEDIRKWDYVNSIPPFVDQQLWNNNIANYEKAYNIL